MKTIVKIALIFAATLLLSSAVGLSVQRRTEIKLAWQWLLETAVGKDAQFYWDNPDQIGHKPTWRIDRERTKKAQAAFIHLGATNIPPATNHLMVDGFL